jgi:drug/metabolite transporter (DMT)-like permease
MSLSAALLALGTIMLWSFLAVLGIQLGSIPPLLVVGITLTLSGLAGAILNLRAWRIPLLTLTVGVGGIFGYHFLYFSAFRHAPAVEANLLNYLWPLLIVVLSPLILSGHPLRPHHLIGAAAGLAGAGLIISGGRLNLDIANLPGYAMAAGAALTWAVYSLLTKRLPPFPTAAVGAFCFFSGLLALAAFGLTGGGWQDVQALSASNWLFLVMEGLGPMGMAFFTWDAALKRGDPRIIGALAYLTPMTSTLALALIGGRSLTRATGLAMALIMVGAVVGSLDLLPIPGRRREVGGPAVEPAISSNAGSG